MKKQLLLLITLGALQATVYGNALTDFFRSSTNKQEESMISSLDMNYPAALLPGQFFKQKIQDVGWNNLLKSIETYIKDAKATELLPEFNNIRNSGLILSNANKLLYNKYAGDFSKANIADFNAFVTPLTRAKYELTQAINGLKKQKKYDSVKKVLYNLIGKLDVTLKSAEAGADQITSQLRAQRTPATR